MKLGIIGQGFVGNAVYQKFSQYYDIKTFDLNESLCNSTFKEVSECDTIFVCLPTPMNPDGSCNIDILNSVLLKLERSRGEQIVIIKSTVPPKTTSKFDRIYRSLDVVFNPEFLTERNAVNDYNNTTRIILGGKREITTRLKPMFSKVFPRAKIIKTDSTYAEMIKYLTNTFLATKVAFANEIYGICKKVGVDYDKVIEYAMDDDRLGKSHWDVPGPDGDFGFGGHCFPKDLAALIKVAESVGTHHEVLSAVQSLNYSVRKNRDWEKMKGRAVVDDTEI